MEMKFKFYLMALLVSMSVIFVACKDKNDEEIVDGAFAAEIAGTYEGTMIYTVEGTSNSDQSPVRITVETLKPNSVTISYIELDEEDEAGAPKRFIDSENGDEEDEDLISTFENVIVQKQGDAYLFVEQKGEQNIEGYGKVTYTLNGGVKNETITLILVTKVLGMTANITLTGTLKETK